MNKKRNRRQSRLVLASRLSRNELTVFSIARTGAYDLKHASFEYDVDGPDCVERIVSSLSHNPAYKKSEVYDVVLFQNFDNIRHGKRMDRALYRYANYLD